MSTVPKTPDEIIAKPSEENPERWSPSQIRKLSTKEGQNFDGSFKVMVKDSLKSPELNNYEKDDQRSSEIYSHYDLPPPHSHRHNDRIGFIRKVYALLCIQLIWTIIVTAIVVSVPSISEGIKNTKGAVIAALIITIFLIFAIMCFKKVARKYPINYIALFTFSIFESYIVAYICAFYDGYIVLAASIIAMAVAFSLTLYAWKTRKDFTTCGGILISMGTSLVLFGFFMIFFSTHYANLIFCEIAIILYSIFIVYDTQLIAGGRYQEISYDDYVIGALILYVDIVGLFLYILSFLGAKN
jgi:protein lifeguard